MPVCQVYSLAGQFKILPEVFGLHDDSITSLSSSKTIIFLLHSFILRRKQAWFPLFYREYWGSKRLSTVSQGSTYVHHLLQHPAQNSPSEKPLAQPCSSEQPATPELHCAFPFCLYHNHLLSTLLCDQSACAFAPQLDCKLSMGAVCPVFPLCTTTWLINV